MNIAIFAAFYKPHTGGYIKNIHELSRRLIAKGHSVTIITCNTDGQALLESMDGVQVMRLPALKILRGLFPIPALSLALQSFVKNRAPYDVILTQTRFFPTSLLGTWYASHWHIPRIHVERGASHIVQSNWMRRVFLHLFDHIFGAWVVTTAQTCIGVSDAACDFMRHLGANNPVTVYNGLDMPLPREHGTGICYVGRLIYGKGIQDLIVAFNRCCVGRDQLHLTIVGDGEYRRELEKQANASPFRERIKFLGTRDYADVLRTLRESHIFVNPSYTEGLPTSVMEAASVGLPIIATDVGGTREIITHGESGLLFQPHDIEALTTNIALMVDDIDKARRMGIKALETVRDKFAWNKIVEKYEEVMKEVC